jgi:thioredoxin-related protein
VSAVSSLEGQWKNGRIIQVNLTFSTASKEFADRLNVQSTPTFILFDSNGDEQRRWTSTVPKLGELP